MRDTMLWRSGSNSRSDRHLHFIFTMVAFMFMCCFVYDFSHKLNKLVFVIVRGTVFLSNCFDLIISFG